MIRAAEKFMPGRGRFISYARHWIRSSLQECVAKESRPVDMPVSASHGLSAVLKQMNKDYSMFGRVDMDPGHLSQQTGLSIRGVEAIICLMSHAPSMSTSRSEGEAVQNGLRRDSPLSRSEKRGDMHSTDESWPDLNSEAPDAIAYHLDNVRLCDLLLSHMNPRQRAVVRRVYLQGIPPAEMARELGVTRQAVDCTLGKALKRARARAEKLQQMGVI
jgi:RNA polymerase sigma factor (sigma-70 family)